MRPSVGRVVHVVMNPAQSPEHLPAVICAVLPPGAHRSNPAVDGTLLNVGLWSPTGQPMEGLQGLPEDQEARRPMSWHWPERLPEEELCEEDAESRLEAVEAVVAGDSEDEETEESE